MEESKKVKYRIAGMESFFIGFFAVVTDFLTMIPFVGSLLGWIFWIFFSMYLLFIKGIWIRAKNLVTMTVSTVVEAIPIVSMLPSITLGIFLTLAQIRVEDKLNSKKEPPAKPKVIEPAEAENPEQESA